MKIFYLIIFILFSCNSDSSVQPPDECGVLGGPGAIYDCGCESFPMCGDVPCCSCDGKADDCLGVCGGNAVVDECGICEGDGVDDDSDGVCDDQDECVGEFDDCSICNGPGVNQCGNCIGDVYDFNGCIDCLSSVSPSSCCDESSIPENSYTILENGDLIFRSDNDIAGFQIDLDDLNNVTEIMTAYPNYEFTVQTGPITILGFSLSGGTIPAGCGTLLNIDSNSPIGIKDHDAIWVAPPGKVFKLNYINP